MFSCARGPRGGGSTSDARSRPFFSIAVTLFAVGLPMRSARTHAASTRSRPYLSASRITPRHVRYPVSGCVRRLMIARASSPTFGPIVSAHAITRSGGHLP
ncbi:hypothetical protein BE08_25870 [Sorangium cellulosum]|uniref:Uncharacterized protein n=1 Tax=Sorangium cellulosum TaxID=56 RepID=A0A150PQI1_SORCE|nr:hypothetical protein BE08_25870 [Sorangium cellulosum]